MSWHEWQKESKNHKRKLAGHYVQLDTVACRTLKVFYKIVISSHEEHPLFTHDALHDGFVAVSLPKN